ncbi:hypothetical protein Tco_0714323 [Tanacetum coccineum]
MRWKVEDEIGDGFDVIGSDEGADVVFVVITGSVGGDNVLCVDVDGEEVFCVEGMCSGELWSGEGEDDDVLCEFHVIGEDGLFDSVDSLERWCLEEDFKWTFIVEDGCSLECHRCKSLEMELIEGEEVERDEEVSGVMKYRPSDRVLWAILLLFP